MDYVKLTFVLSPYNADAADILMAQLGQMGYDGFVETAEGFETYIRADQYNPTAIDTANAVADGVTFSYTEETIPNQDWNKTWEENYFSPVLIGGRCLVRSTFHPKTAEAEYEIIINPQMAFGTGHHETTCLVAGMILNRDMKGKRILDMGCGTGILGILASKCGAVAVHGIDIDTWCVDNAMDNIKLNDIGNMTVALGGAEAIAGSTGGKPYDIIFANINRNILLADMEKYVAALAAGGTLIMSGFYTADIPLINDEAQRLALTQQSVETKNDWAAVEYIKQ